MINIPTRGFDESLKNDRTRATHALTLYQSLFEIEADLREKKATPEERLAKRQEKSVPLMTELKEWFDTQIKEVRPKSPIGKAITYCLNRWKELTVFLENGRVEISTNVVENRIRILALGRKNWLFVGNEEAARRMAIIYSIQGTCKALGINFRKYLEDILEKLPNRKGDDIDDLLPMNWNPDKK